MNIVVVGGGFAGVKAAIELSKRHIGKVTLISDEPYFLHHATLYATATGKSMAESVIPLAHIFDYYPNVTVVNDTMTAIDPRRRLIVGQKKQYHYDKAVIAIGSVTTYFGIKGMAEHAYGIKNIEEIKQFNNHIHEDVVRKKLDREYFVIGAGPTGVEMAGALMEYLRTLIRLYDLKHSKARVTIVEAAPTILPRISKTAAKKVTARMKKMGIKVMLNHKVEALDDDNIVIDGTTYPTSCAIWTSGVANNPFFAAQGDTFHLAPNGRVEVDQYLEAIPNVYVLGDNNTAKNSGLAWPALDQATFIAKHLTRIASKQPLMAYRPRRFIQGVPVGDDWAYVERFGVYAAGKSGAAIRRWMELQGYKKLMPSRVARDLWRAHNIPEIDV
jgi:NADH:ubiquinone reductase (H+-translocating)